ncbi:MAG TPA: DnaJ domain-containing protein [Candidatus Polarisedimenticolaceae bacterium]|nr:DnaJ domain-containing protein [Candidatus Polarisedimenticolaceae bacterium]
MPQHDRLGYYRILNIGPDAGAAEIRLAYELLKTAYREGRRNLEIGKIREAYAVLGDPSARRAYDRADGRSGGGGENLLDAIRQTAARVKIVPVGLGLVAVGVIVLLGLIGPDLRAQFVSFEPGDALVWSATGEALGSVVAFDQGHTFSSGAVGRAYRIEPAAGGGPVWYPARDLERYCRTR